MVKVLIDPSVFAPPQGPCLPWLSFLRQWSQTLKGFESGAVTPVMSQSAQAAMNAQGGRAAIQAAIDQSNLPISVSDVVQLIEAIRGRAKDSVEAFEPADVVFNRLTVGPDYVDSGQNEVVEAFRQDLGHGAAFQQETASRVAAITVDGSWTESAARVAVTGEVEAWEKFGIIEEPDDQVATVSEDIELWRTARCADKTFNDCWADLIDYPNLGIEVAYRGFTAESDEREYPLKFEVGARLSSSMRGMGYAGKKGRIKRVFFAAAYVASQRGGDLSSLQPHAYRKSKSTNSQAVERSDGAKLMRGKLGTGANAHRLMWWDGPTPVILGVVGHDDDPRLLSR